MARAQWRTERTSWRIMYGLKHGTDSQSFPWKATAR